MIITVEMSLYPLTDEYTEHVIKFIKALNGHEGVEVLTTAMSTYVQGEYKAVMDLLQRELEVLYKVLPANATVIKIIPKKLNIQDGYLSFV